MVTGPFVVDNLTSLDAADIAAEITDSAYEYDLIIAAHSVESRSVQIPQIVQTSGAVKLAFSTALPALSTDLTTVAESNKKRLIKSGFAVEDLSSERIDQIIHDCADKTVGNIRAFVDVTCLPRRAIADVLCALATTTSRGRKIELALGYTLARYSPPSSHPLAANKRVAPVHPMLAGWTDRSKLPVTSVVGLGYEKGKALGAVEYLQANSAASFLFLPSSPEQRFRPKVERHNLALIKAVGPAKKIDYDVIMPVHTLLMMDSLVAAIKRSRKPVLLPFGPKIFFALSVLVGLAHQEAAVWYVSGEEDEPPENRAPTPYSFALRCNVSCKPAESTALVEPEISISSFNDGASVNA